MLKINQKIAALLLIASFWSPANAIEPGQPAPDFLLNGTPKNITLSELKGQVVYLDFWASWCGPCRKSFPWMNSLQAKYSAQGLTIVAVNLDTNAEDVKRFLAATPANFNIAYDPKGAVARQFNIKGMPSSLLIDRDGKVIMQHAGFNDETRLKLERTLQSLFEKK